jgi:hypothetical protein
MDPIIQFLIGAIWAVIVAFGGLWFAGGFEPPPRK